MKIFYVLNYNLLLYFWFWTKFEIDIYIYIYIYNNPELKKKSIANKCLSFISTNYKALIEKNLSK